MPFHPDIKDRELAALLGTGALIHALADFAAGGGIQKVERDVLMKILKKAGRHAGRSGLRLAGTALTGARFVALRHPALTTLGVLWLAWENQDAIRNFTSQGYEIVSDTAFGQPGPGATQRERFRPGPAMVPLGHGIQPPHPIPDYPGIVFPPIQPRGLVKRTVSKANKAVKKAMQILKKERKGKKLSKKQRGTVWKVATKAAGLANPNTKSKIGKGNTPTKKLARKLKKWW